MAKGFDVSDDYDRKHEHFLHSDKIASEIGLSALKTTIVLNAGSLVALLAFAGQVWNQNDGRRVASGILIASHPFCLGVALGGLAFGCAYIYQLFVTALRNWDMQPAALEIDAWPFTKKCTQRVAIRMQMIMIILALLSLSSFIWGMWNVNQVLK